MIPTKCFIIEWHGPFTYEYLKNTPSDKIKDFRFYALSGCCKYQKGTPTWLYCGITERIITKRFKDKGHKISDITRNREIWLGRFSNPVFSRNRRNIELVEYLIISAYDLALNKKKTKSYPPSPVGIINIWYTKNGERRVNKTHVVQKELADTIFFDGINIWTSNKLKRWM